MISVGKVSLELQFRKWGGFVKDESMSVGGDFIRETFQEEEKEDEDWGSVGGGRVRIESSTDGDAKSATAL